MELTLVQQMLTNQYEAALCMLSECMERCPNDRWQEPVASHPFSTTVFHTLFYTDVYLGPGLDAVYEQPFHRNHLDQFEGYEELERRPPERTYAKPFLADYLQHCLEKMRTEVASETDASLAKDPGFDWLPFSRAEVHLYNIRHIHHHAAQLSLRLRLDGAEAAPWISSRWNDE